MTKTIFPYFYQKEIVRQWPFTTDSFDCTLPLSEAEKEALIQWRVYWSEFRKPQRVLLRKSEVLLQRFIDPLNAALAHYGGGKKIKVIARSTILDYMCARQTSFWSWSELEWLEIIGSNANDFQLSYVPSKSKRLSNIRHCLIACAYLLGNQVETLFFHIWDYKQTEFAIHIFGTAALIQAYDKVAAEINRLGLGPSMVYANMPTIVADTLLLNRSPRLEEISYESVQRLCIKYEAYEAKRALRNASITFSRILHGLGVVPRSIPRERQATGPRVGVLDSMSLEWGKWIQRWYDTSTSATTTRNGNRVLLCKAARWVSKTYPEVTDPTKWTREICAAYIAEVLRMNAGDWTHPNTRLGDNKVGKPLSAAAKSGNITTLRKFFIDCQDWDWIPIKFNPKRVFRIPNSIKTAMGTKPRVIANDIWAKLMHAGLNLTKEDLPVCLFTREAKIASSFQSAAWYPFEMVKAITLVWLFAGLRNDEIRRLRVGCTRWEAPEGLGDGTEDGSEKSICLLNVPINKTSNSFVKPVDTIVGKAVQAWEKLRPKEPPQQDKKASEQVHFLFTWRGKIIGGNYINLTIIPMLCQKAGVPLEDTLGRITSHCSTPQSLDSFWRLS